MILPLLITLVIISPIASYIVTYQCFYSRMPCEGINNVNKVGVEKDTKEDTEEDNVEHEENNIRSEENAIGAESTLSEIKENYIDLEEDNIIIFFNDNIRVK